LNRRPLIRLAAAAVFGGLFALGLLAFLLAVNPGQGFARCTATTGLGWLVPLVSGLTVAMLSAVLLTGRSRSYGDDVGIKCRCSACQGRVLDGWRLCPHCGALLDSETTDISC
jgi:hypothetical protein